MFCCPQSSGTVPSLVDGHDAEYGAGPVDLKGPMIQIGRAFSRADGDKGSSDDAGRPPTCPSPQGQRAIPSGQETSISEAVKIRVVFAIA